MKTHKKPSHKGILVTTLTTTLITSAVIFGLIYYFKPQSPTEDLSRFFQKIPGLKSTPTNISLSSAGLDNDSTKVVSKDNLKQANKDLDGLDIDNFDASISQNDQ